MKKLILILTLALFALSVNAQNQKPFSLDKQIAEIGNVKIAHWGKAVFTIKNQSKQPIFIVNAEGSCGCVRVDYSSKPINPGQTAKITVKYRPVETGEFKKAAYIELSAGGTYHNVTLVIKGKAVR